MIVIGSSLVVYPAAYMPMYAKESGAKLGDHQQYAHVLR